MNAMTYMVYITLFTALLILPAVAVVLARDGSCNRLGRQPAVRPQVWIPNCQEASNDWLDQDRDRAA